MSNSLIKPRTRLPPRRSSDGQGREGAKGYYANMIKAGMDILLALVIVLVLSWLIGLILLAYVISWEFPVFFWQVRLGKDEKQFVMMKFRTLKAAGGSLTERKFMLGNLLRATSLDELPQLWNVMKGDMSLIGPRPLPVEYGPLFSPDQRKRFRVKPGITGWAQVNGRHGIPWQKKFELDNWYVDHQSFWLDLRIILKTALLLLSFRKDTSLEEPPFTGSN